MSKNKELIEVLTRMVAKQGREIAELKSQVAIQTEQIGTMIQALENVRIGDRMVMKGGDEGSPEERRREYKRLWIRARRARALA